MTEPLFHRVAVIGVGLLGASFALAARSRGLAGHVAGVGRSRENLERAVSIGAIDEFTHDAASGVRNADLVVLAAPVGSLSAIAESVSGSLESGCIVIDVGSVKGGLVSNMESLMPDGVSFVGCHPIAGGSTSGAGSARADLFVGARCIITPTAGTNPQALAKVESLWRALGSTVEIMEPDEHDRIFAAVSHLPHLLAYALVGAVSGEDGLMLHGGRGFRDTTRIAGSPPEIWRDIFGMNRDNLIASLDRFETVLKRYRALIEASDFDTLCAELAKAREARESLENG
ncbi:MAG: prephenate dehydrogenase/arogenate dehydrogenase family protein [Nitrospirae bacterium]|nr:prephenate dehydrogenase/arogenate dehydrogenase family protein [Nitrospirota bacterium]